jgi:hypothetical protein
MAGRLTTELMAAGSRINGWVKVGVVVVGLIGGYFTLRADVRTNTREYARQEVVNAAERQEIKEEHREDMQLLRESLNNMDRKLDRLIEREIGR